MNKNINFNSYQLSEMNIEQSISFYWDLKLKVIRYFFNKYYTIDSKVLDIGCGTGFIAANLNIIPSNYSAQDVFQESEIFLRKNIGNEITFINSQIELINKNNYQIILLLDVLEHVNDDLNFLNIVNSLLTDNGILIITTPAHQWLYSQLDKDAGHVRRYSHKQLDDKLKNAGFKKISTSSFLIITLPLQIISRIILNKSNSTVIKEHNSWINSFLKLLNPFDLLLCKSMFFKFGGSLVFVYKK